MGKVIWATVLVVAIGVAGLSEDWPMGGRDPGRSSAVSQTIPPPLLQAWAAALPGTVQEIVAAGDTVVAATGSHWVVALDIATGEERWRFQVPGARGVFSAAPAIRSGLVLVGCQLAAALYALDLATGEVRWRRPGLADLRSDICLVGDLALVSHFTDLYALDPTSGEEVWHRGLPAVGSPAAAGGLVFVTLFGGELAALSLSSGAEIWRKGGAWAGSASDPVVVGELVALVTGDEVRLWTREAGWAQGAIPLPHRQFSGKPWRPGVAGDRLFVVLAGEERGWLIPVETSSRRVPWSVGLAGLAYSPCLAGGVVYVAAGNSLVALGQEDGKILWQREFPREAATGPIAAGGAILCGFGNTLYKLVPEG